MTNDSIIILDPVNMKVIKDGMAKGIRTTRRQLHGIAYADVAGVCTSGTSSSG